MKYSVIIPTMYFHKEQLVSMLSLYNSIDYIGEILIINNNSDLAVQFNEYKKVKTIGTGVNMYVNPSWSFGVKNAKFDKIILVNDDITVMGDLSSLLEKVAYILREGVIVGVGEKCYSNEVSRIQLIKRPIIDKTRMGYGFGVFMCMSKSTFLNTPIPDAFLVWYGDHVLYYKNTAWVFEGVCIITGMRGTTSKINLSGFAAKEKQAFKHFLNLNK